MSVFRLLVIGLAAEGSLHEVLPQAKALIASNNGQGRKVDGN
jgi:hypothetical protein